MRSESLPKEFPGIVVASSCLCEASSPTTEIHAASHLFSETPLTASLNGPRPRRPSSTAHRPGSTSLHVLANPCAPSLPKACKLRFRSRDVDDPARPSPGSELHSSAPFRLVEGMDQNLKTPPSETGDAQESPHLPKSQCYSQYLPQHGLS